MERVEPFADLVHRLKDADVVLIAQDGYRLAPARVRCFNFAKLLNGQGLRAEPLSFYDHLGASEQGAGTHIMTEAEKIRLNLAALDALSHNARAVLYVQKVGYHVLAASMAAARNGNRLILDYDDYDLENPPLQGLEPFIPSLRPDLLLASFAARCDSCVAASHALHGILRASNPNTHLIHTVADGDVFSHAGRNRPRQRFGDAVNLLWCGDVWGDLVAKDVVFAADAFASLPRRIRAKARLHVIGFGLAWEALKRRLRERHPEMGELVLHEHIPPSQFGDVLNEMDIGLLPYADHPFNRGKSPTKLFEFMIAGVTACATPVGEVVHCLEDGVSVALGSGIAGYSAAMARLIDDGAFRRRLADTAHDLARGHYTLDAAAPRLAAIVRAALDRGPARPGDSRGDLHGFMTRRLGRRRPISPREVLLTQQDLRSLAGSGDPAFADPRRFSEPLLALLQWPDLGQEEGIAPDRIAALRSAAETGRPSASLRPLLRVLPAPPAAGPVLPSLSKLCAAEDWENDSWFDWAWRFKTNFLGGAPDRRPPPGTDAYDVAYSYFKRSRGAWERIQLLHALDRTACLRPDARIAVVSDAPDGFYLVLSTLVGSVLAVDAGPDADATAAVVADGRIDPWLLKPRVFRHDRLTVFHGAMERAPEAPAFDAVVVVHNTALRHGAAGLESMLRWADGRLAPGGVLAFSAEVALAGDRGGPWLATDALGPEGLEAAIGTHTGLRLTGGSFESSMSDATLDRLAITGEPSADNPHLVVRTGPVLHTASVWTLRKAGPTTAAGWKALRSAFDRWLVPEGDSVSQPWQGRLP